MHGPRREPAAKGSPVRRPSSERLPPVAVCESLSVLCLRSYSATDSATASSVRPTVISRSTS